MKKLITLIIISAAFSFASFAQTQTFNFMPGEYIVDYVELDQYKNFQVDLVHEQYDDMTFGWVTVENNLLDKWEYTSCDNGGCYTALPDSATIGPLADTVNGFIRITLNPRDQLGTGTATFYVYNVKFPDNGQFVTFEITATELTSIEETVSGAFRIYPNPASDFLQLKNGSPVTSQFVLTDINGRIVKEMLLGARTENTVQISDLPRGMYLVRFSNTETTTTEKVLIQ